MKSIEIIGKHNKDKINKSKDNNFIAERNSMINIQDNYFNHTNQINIINSIYLSINNNLDNNNINKIILKEIDKKILSYKNQDIVKNKYNNNNISSEQVIEKLVASKLKCFYCKNKTYILYKKVRDMEQWSLDRIDNSIPHTNDNVIISCLKCNLQRRCQNKDNFLFTKQLKIEKSL